MSIQFMGVQLGLLPGQHHDQLGQEPTDPLQPPAHITITHTEHVPFDAADHLVSPSEVSSFSLPLPSDLLPEEPPQAGATAAAAAAGAANHFVAEPSGIHVDTDGDADDEDLDAAGPYRTLSELYADAWYHKSILKVKQKASKARRGSSDTTSESSNGSKKRGFALKWPLRRQGSAR
jgi:hypothetical protein